MGRQFANIRRVTALIAAIGAVGAVFVGKWLWVPFLLTGCTSQWAFGPAAWNTAPPVIPGFTSVPLAGGGFIEEPTSAITPPPETLSPTDSTLAGLQKAQTIRTLVRQLAR